MCSVLYLRQYERIFSSILLIFLDNMRQFSAVCWLFGKRMFEEFGHPIGLITSAYSATRIQAWTSPDGLAACESKDKYVAALYLDGVTNISMMFTCKEYLSQLSSTMKSCFYI